MKEAGGMGISWELSGLQSQMLPGSSWQHSVHENWDCWRNTGKLPTAPATWRHNLIFQSHCKAIDDSFMISPSLLQLGVVYRNYRTKNRKSEFMFFICQTASNYWSKNLCEHHFQSAKLDFLPVQTCCCLWAFRTLTMVMAVTFLKHFIKEIHTKAGGSCKYVLFSNLNVNTQFTYKTWQKTKDLIMEGYNYVECCLQLTWDANRENQELTKSDLNQLRGSWKIYQVCQTANVLGLGDEFWLWENLWVNTKFPGSPSGEFENIQTGSEFANYCGSK